jgi:hypothetical protein
MKTVYQNSSLGVGHFLAQLRGRPVVDFFPHLCRMRPEIAELRFETFKPRPGIDERLGALLMNKGSIRNHIEEIRATESIPFWDAVASYCMSSGTIPDEIVHTALLHEPNPTTVSTSLSAQSIIEGEVAVLSKKAVRDDSVAVCSKVRLASGVEAHIPMLDFRCPVSDSNSDAILRMLKHLGEVAGLLVASGRSYHYYGVALYDEGQWLEFMAKALLLRPITDDRFIAHRLIDGQCRLRIYSPSRPVPVIVGALHNAS